MPRHSSHILELARRGAEHRYEELLREITALTKSFPHLRTRSSARQIDVSSEPAATVDRPARKRRHMSAAQRKAVSARMKKFWAARRKVKVGQRKS